MTFRNPRHTPPALVALAMALALGTAGAAARQVVIQSTGSPSMIGEFAGGGTPARAMDPGTGVVVGRVVEADNRGPVTGAIVTLTLPGFTPVRALTDGQGRFAFRALPKGTYSLATTRPGFVDGALGRVRPGGVAQSLELSDNERTDAVAITMWRHAAIAGTILDENNEPLVGTPVRALRREFVGGRRTLSDSGSDSTDDRGQFRIGSLEPGEYVIVLPITQRPSLDSMVQGLRQSAASGGGARQGAAVFAIRATSSGSGAPVVMTTLDGSGVPAAGTDENGFPLTYQTEYFTGALTASSATAIVLNAGDERTGVDFRVVPVRSLSLTGTVIGPEGPAANVQVQLIPADAGDLVSPIETATASTDSTGHFEFTGVPAGQYLLRAQRTPSFAGPGQRMSFTTSTGGGGQMVFTTREVIETSSGAAPLPTDPTLWAEVSVGVNLRSLADVTVPLREGLTVSGPITFQGSAAKPAPEAVSNITISLEPADGRTAGLTSVVRGRVDANGTFATIGVPAGKYVLRVSGAPQGWSLRSATFGGRDITTTAVELSDASATGVVLSFTDRPSNLDGSVRDALGNPDVSASVLIFPADPTRWVDTGSQPRQLQSARVDRTGAFKVPSIPPGDYFVIAVADSAPRTWQDPAYLQALSRLAEQVRIGEGDARTINLTSMKGPA